MLSPFNGLFGGLAATFRTDVGVISFACAMRKFAFEGKKVKQTYRSRFGNADISLNKTKIAVVRLPSDVKEDLIADTAGIRLAELTLQCRGVRENISMEIK